MELALYAPGAGYYERSPRRIGRLGDFQTSVSVGPLLGDLLAFHFARLFEDSPRFGTDHPLDLVESGAHDGRLAGDILGWIETWRPKLMKRTRLWLVEPSPARREWQRESLRRFGRIVQWVRDLEELQQRTGGIQGVIYSNELLDAFPVHCFVWNAVTGCWAERGVGMSGSEWVWKALPPDVATAADPDRTEMNALPRALLAVLPDGFATETCPAAVEWWQRASKVLRTGALVTLDYGFADAAPLRPEFPDGSLRAYRKHQLRLDVLSDPGEQDITAQVDFEIIARAGEAAGLRTVVRTSQRQWLTAIFERTLAPEAGFPKWDSRRVRQFQTLTHPEHLGRRFQVLGQVRGLDDELDARRLCRLNPYSSGDRSSSG